MKTNLTGIIAVLLFATLLSPLVGQEPLPDGNEDNPRVPNVMDQFSKLKHHGEALGFWRRNTPNPNLEKHYQGMVRKNGPGTPYLFLSLNGNWTFSSGTDTAGHIIVVRMDSRGTDGERLRSNKLVPNQDFDDTPPPSGDEAVATISFDGANGFPHFAHPGGMQLIGDILVVPVTNRLGGEILQNAIVLIDVADPENPVHLHTFGIPYECGAVAVTRLEDDRYLVAGLAQKMIHLYISDSTDLRTTAFSHWDDYDASGIVLRNQGTPFPVVWPGGSNSFQMINFIRDTNGELYLMATWNNGIPPSILDQDWLELFSVEANVTVGSEHFSLQPRGTLHQYMTASYTGRIGNNFAAAGTYVSPTGQLIVYSGEHEDEGPQNSVRIGEFRNREVHTDPLKQPCGGWVELYADNTGWDGGDRSIVLDYQDLNHQNLLDFDNTQGFGDQADSLSYFLLPGQWFELYENQNQGGRSLRFEGTGRVEYVPRLDDWDGFGDETHSIVVHAENNPPLIAFTSLNDGDLLTSLPALEGVITDDFDDFGTPSATLTIQEINSPCGVNRSWNGTAWQANPITIPMTVAGETWTFPVESLPPLHSGLSYQLTVSATDQCGNTDTDTVTVSVPVTELTWDPGFTHLGTEVLNHSAELGGAWIFKITAQASLNGAWRTALNVLQGEAEVSMSPDYPALPDDAQFRSQRIGSDGWVLHSSQFAESQEWYLVVCAEPGAQWNLVSGEVFIHELGTLAGDASSGTDATMGAESMLFFRTTVPADTLAWRLWLDGAPNTLYIAKNQVPHPLSYELTQAGQMLVVPPYLSFDSHFIAVAGDSGAAISLDSRQQAVSDLAFVSDSDLAVGHGEFPYLTFRVEVPLQQIAWQLNLIPATGDPGVALRRDQVPNEFRNDGISDVAAPAGDSVTLVPPPADSGPGEPGLSDGTYYVTVYAGGAYSASLSSGNPVITDVPFSFNVINDDPNRSGWRYYRVPNIPEQLNSLGWELNLLNHVHPGTEIALRRNAVPGSWSYRDADNELHAPDTFGYSDYSGTSGFLQRINHQADVWYVGIYTPDQALGNFNLDLHPIVPATVGLNGSNTAVTNLESGRWKFLRVDFPPGVLGWDLRVRDVTGGNPRIVVARDVLPSTFSTDWSPSESDEWPSGESWTQETDWTGRSYDPDETSVIHRRFVAGMGRPLEPGTYYVGVYNAAGAGQADFTLNSRGIGSGQILTVSNLGFAAGSSATITNLAPREARYFKVTIPTNTPSWEVILEPTVGEMMLLVRREAIPDPSYSGSWGSTQSDAGSRQYRVKKAGPERHVILPPDDTEFLVPGDYYLAVVSEGQDPQDTEFIGTGSSSGTLVSQGSLVVPHLGAASVEGVNQAVSLAGGQTKAYQFTITPGTPSVEILLNNRVGNPRMAVVGGAGLPPGTGWFWPYQYGSEGGQQTGNPELLLDNQLITIANPPVGTYSVTVSAAYDPESSWAPAAATLSVQIAPPDEVAFNGGTSVVTEQQAQSWKYFRVDVPPGVLGWDLKPRDVTGGNPQMVVARDVLPSAIGTDWSPSESSQWPSSYMWTQSTDWTGRGSDSDEQSMAHRRFVAGMGRPLEPGSYYVGVYNAHSFAAASYTLESRGIGAGQFYTVSNLGFAAGSSATVTNLAPREARYFKVTVPVNTPTWEITLDPTVGEMMLMVRRGAIPDPSHSGSWGSTQSAEGSRQFRVQKDGSERHVILPPDDTEFLVPGDYYLAVVSEGQDLLDSSHTGSGNSSGTLTSRGSLAIPHFGAATVAGLTQAVSLAAAQMKGYQFTVPEGTATLEVRLNNRVGNPQMALVGGMSLPPGTGNFYPNAYGSEGGQSSGTPSLVSDDNLITMTNPPAGTYTVTVCATYDIGGNSYDPAAADLLIQVKLPFALNFAASLNGNGNSNMDTRQVIDGERTLYAVPIPLTLAGQPVLGWEVNVSTTEGNAILRIYKNAGDTSPEYMITVSSRTAIIVPPWLTPGETWYAEVEAQGPTEYSITSSSLELHREPWAMPVTFNQTFGDSGLQNNGSPLPGDQGIDLARDDWHFYAIDVPSGNSGLLRTELQAISGNPDLYIREDGVPTIHHNDAGSTSVGESLIDRSLTGPNSEYGNWVPLNGRTETHLRSGRWYLGVKAGSTQNVRYRLKISTGVVTDLNLEQPPMPGQSIVGGDWRYYRFTIPMDAPNQWLLTFSQQVGDVVMWIRDTVPPGDDAQSRPDYRIAWNTDSKNQDPYPSYDPAGTYTISTPQLRPGHTYFAGFRSIGDAAFTISSSTAGGSIGAFPALDFYNGAYSGTIPANGSTVVTVTAPANASRWKHSATHSSGVDIRIEQGSLVSVTGDAHYVNYVGDDSSLNVPLNSWPWVPGVTYFVRFVNTTGGALPLNFVMNGANPNNEDEDEDGLPDIWEEVFFDNIWQFNADDDADFDGLKNIIEYAFKLQPTVPGTPILTTLTGTSGLPRITTVGSGPTQRLRLEYVRMKASFNPGITYVPQFSSNLQGSGTGGWTAASGPETLQSIDTQWERVVIEDTAGTGLPNRFGRVLVTAP